MFRILYLFVSTLLLSSCVSQTTVDEYGRIVIHNFGYVKIIKPPAVSLDQEINVTGYKLLGFSVGDGFTLGYKENEYMKIPTDCRLLVIVQDKGQLEHLLSELNSIGENELCATVSAK